jgi:hypothetical protein
MPTPNATQLVWALGLASAVATNLTVVATRAAGERLVLDLVNIRTYGATGRDRSLRGILSLGALLLARTLLSSPGLSVALMLTLVASACVLAVGRRSMRLSEAFPELAQGPLARLL